MARKLTQDEWKVAAVHKHNGKYSYDLVKYSGSLVKVEITCTTHGNFWQMPASHMAGRGCRQCGIDETASKQTATVGEFIEKSRSIHNYKYDYSKVIYTGCKNRVDIICTEHGVFSQTPDSHLSGYGCDKCAHDLLGFGKRKTQEDFIMEARAEHSERYSYEMVQYTTNNTPVEIYCPEHGYFFQNPVSHLAGRGCPKCMKCGYSTGKEGHLYILTNENVTKVGITNRRVETRVSEINKRGAPNLQIVKIFHFADGEIPQRLESQAHDYLRSLYQPVSETFDGSTECFLDVDLQALISFVTPLATVHQ